MSDPMLLSHVWGWPSRGNPKFIGEIVAGKDPRKPPAPPAAEGMTVAEFLDQYYER